MIHQPKKLIFLVIALVFLSTLPIFAKDTNSAAQKEFTDEMFFADRYILILKSTKDYGEAVTFAKKAGKGLGLEFDNKHREYSKKKGIYFSKDYEDDDYAGSYYPRRYPGESVTLENSADYEGFSPGYIIVVGGIYNDKSGADKALSRVKKIYKRARIRKTNMWMGCIH
ncbi:MAG: hypothetical protein WCI77_01980 [Candidatus Omnitrophota bacterium]